MRLKQMKNQQKLDEKTKQPTSLKKKSRSQQQKIGG